MRFSSKLSQIRAILGGWNYEAEVKSLQCRLQVAENDREALRTGHAQLLTAYKALDANLAETQIALVETEDHNEILKETIKALRGPNMEAWVGTPDVVAPAVDEVKISPMILCDSVTKVA